MSDDHKDASVASDDATPRSAVAQRRVALWARAPKAADALWEAIDNRIRTKEKLAVVRSQRADADVVVYLLAAEDFADAETARTLAAEISGDTAPLRLLLEPAPVDDAGIRMRIAETLAAIGRRKGAVTLSSEKQAGEDAADVLRRQAKAVAIVLKRRSAGPPPSAQSESEPLAQAEEDDATTARAQKKAAKRAARLAKKAQRRSTKDETARSEASEKAERKGGRDKAASRADKPSADAKRKTKRAARSSLAEKPAPDDDAGPCETATATKADRQATPDEPKRPREKESRRRQPRAADAVAEDDEFQTADAADELDASQSDRPLSIAIVGMDEGASAALRRALQDGFGAAGIEVSAPRSPNRAEIFVYAFDHPPLDAEEIGRQAEVFAKDATRLRIFLERAAPPAAEGAPGLDAENRAIATLAIGLSGTFLELSPKFRRYGIENMIVDGRPSRAGYGLIAASILGIAAGRKPSRRSFACPPPDAPPDLVEARALSDSPSQLLSLLSWSARTPPKSLWTHVEKEGIEEFAQSKMTLPSGETLDLDLPIDWKMALPDRRARGYLQGLEFLSAPLAYWYGKANGRGGDNIAEIDAVLKQRGVTASSLLTRIGEIIVDFARKHPRQSAPEAWQESVVAQRARVFVLFVLCCKTAAKRRIKFDEAMGAAVFHDLLDLSEALRTGDSYAPCCVEGVEQDCLLIGLALALRKTAYAQLLLRDGLDRLNRLQLGLGLYADGVWRQGSFAAHCSVLSSLSILMGDFDASDAAMIEPIAAAAKKMTVFAEAMLKSDGHAIALEGGRQISYAKRLNGVRQALSRLGFGGKTASARPARIRFHSRITETYGFRDARYFISHSTQKVSPDSSQVVLHARRASVPRGDPGGVTLVFAHGPDDLLVRAEPAERIRPRQDQAPLFDPALRNGYHVDGVGYSPEIGIEPNATRIVKSWRGPGWAAAKSVDGTYAGAVIGRVAIHLKAHHALIVVDELAGDGGEAKEFEQFWNIAPAFAPPASNESPLRFASPEQGGLTVRFDARLPSVVAIDKAGAGPCLRRRARLSRGVMASLFQWTDNPAPAALGVERGELGDWVVVASGAGFEARLSLAGDELLYAPLGGA